MLLESVRRRIPLGIASLCAMAFAAAATAGYAWLVGPLLRDLGPDPAVAAAPGSVSFPQLSITQIVWILVALGVVRALSETARTHLGSRFQLSAIREFRGEVLAHVLRIEPSALLQWPRGELASRIQVEVHGVRTLLHMGLAQGIRSALVATALAIVALQVDSALAIPGLLVMPVAVAVVLLAARPARRLQRELYGAESSVVSDTAEVIDGAPVLRAFGAVGPAWAKIDQGAARAQDRGVAAETWSAAAAPLVELAGAMSIALVFAFAASTRSSVDLAPAGTVLVSLVLMYRPLHGLAQAVFGWWSGLASLDRLDELLRNPAEPWQPVWRRAEPIVSLRLNDLSFGYDDQPVLRRANASLQGGSLVVITGASGSGKSTLLGLLSGVLPASPNGIWIDGVPASRDSLTAATAWMPQSPSLFHDTILRNVALGSDRPDRARVIEVCQRVGAHSFIAARHRGYDGMLREGGSDLSVGQRQRITLARALYRGAPLLLVDEPTSALDDELECRVVAVCRERAERGDLVIVATHREDFLRHADCVLELQEGVMSEWERRVVDARLH